MIRQIKQKRQKKLQLQDEVVYMTKMRATFINFRRKMEGNLVDLEHESDGDETSSIDTD
jgi:hypothetical protein